MQGKPCRECVTPFLQQMNYDALILGAGAAGLFCAAEAAKRGARVGILERSDKPGKKILISGGGRCNFTNLHTAPDRFLSANPSFCISALRRHRPQDVIAWIEGAGVYVNLHVGGKELLYRAALNELADCLDPVRFVRVHRSAIVNIDSIVELQPISHGEFEMVLKDGHRSRVSRTYRALLEKRLGQSL